MQIIIKQKDEKCKRIEKQKKIKKGIGKVHDGEKIDQDKFKAQ